MINPEKHFNIYDYYEIVLRRIWFIVIPFVVIAAGTVLYALYAPREYKATTLIMVSPQKVPEQFVKSTITSNIEERLQSISQEIMSRTRLEQIISEFKLYPEMSKRASKEEIVELMRKNILIEIPKKDKEKSHFTISYVGNNPQVVANVTAKLTSSFIEENLKVREQQAQGTSEFLNVEMESTKTKLENQEKTLTGFKRQFIGELPEQKDANLRVLEQLQNSFQRVSENLRSARDRKVVVQKQLTDIELMMTSLSKRPEVPSREGKEVKEIKEESTSPPTFLLGPSPSPPPPQPKIEAKDPLEVQLEKLKASLKELQMRYTDKHPDIILTKKTIKDLEAQVETARLKKEAEEKRLEDQKRAEQADEEGKKKEVLSQIRVTPLAPPGKETPPKKETSPRKEAPVEKVDDRAEKQELMRLYQRQKEVESQLVATDLEIERLKEEEGRIQAQIARYRERIENTPIREQAITDLTRDYQNTREAYNALLQRTQEAQRAENLERRQKGEQFRIVDPARVPEKPFKPDIPKVLLIGLFMAGGIGLGTAFFREQMDRSFRDAGDLEIAVGLRVLANIPKVKEEPAAQNA
jgi:uncharacterized protein involved in exopolysaccharide biosynthesis